MILKGIATRFTLGKNERLKSRKLIGHLFSGGKSVTAFPLKALYIISTDENSLQAGFTVSTKNFKKAVNRNRIKRLMRESYRLQKNALQKKVSEVNKGVILFFIYTGKEIVSYKEMQEKMGTILNTLFKNISAS